METYYLTKYALTKGIEKVWGEAYSPPMSENKYVRVRGLYSTHYRLGTDAHETYEDAVKKANEMKISKLQSLDRQIKKISKLEFK